MLIGELERLVAEHPHREKLRAQLMLALYRAGRQVDALGSYRRAQAALAELGIEPGQTSARSRASGAHAGLRARRALEPAAHRRVEGPGPSPRCADPGVAVPLRRPLTGARAGAGAARAGRDRRRGRPAPCRQRGLRQDPDRAGAREGGRRVRGARSLRVMRRRGDRALSARAGVARVRASRLRPRGAPRLPRSTRRVARAAVGRGRRARRRRNRRRRRPRTRQLRAAERPNRCPEADERGAAAAARARRPPLGRCRDAASAPPRRALRSRAARPRRRRLSPHRATSTTGCSRKRSARWNGSTASHASRSGT